MIFIDSDTIGRAAPIGHWVKAMEDALMDTAKGKLFVPPRTHIDRDENSLFIMPCFGEDYFSTKLVSVYPKNLLKKRPVIYGTVVLNDGGSGKPLAAMDGSKLTAMRTAAVGSVGIKYLAPEDADSLGIIGLGIQGFHQALFACWQRPVKKLRILDRSKSVMERFASRFKAFYRDIEVIPCKSAIELCRSSKIIIAATGSRNPVVPASGEWWKGKTLIGIGSYKPDMREFPGEIPGGLSQIFVDTLHAMKEAGDLLLPLQEKMLKEEQVLPLSDLISGRVQKKGDTGFFKSVGMAAFDLYGARLVYESQN